MERAFTRLELLVVIFLMLLVTIFVSISTTTRGKEKAQRIVCIQNLKQIATVTRLWEYDNPGWITNGGWDVDLARSNAGAFCWVYYSAMATNFGDDLKILTCPADDRFPGTNGEVLKDNSHLSYFVGAGAINTSPESVRGGDRNLGPGTIPDPNYGYSPADGTGNDVIITNAACWSLKMHSGGNRAGAGNIMLGDGSAQQCSTAGLRFWLPSAKPATNTPSMRLIFP